MIKNSTRKVYIVNNFKSDKIEQAIFILKSGCEFSGKINSDLALEAQKIINDYVIKIEDEKNKVKSKKSYKSGYFLTLIMLLSVLIVFGLVSYLLVLGITNIW